MPERMDPMADMAAGATNPDKDYRPKIVHPKAARTVIVLLVSFKFSREHCGRDESQIRHGLSGWPYRQTMHTDREIAFVVETSLTADELLKRLAVPLAANCIEIARAFTPGADAASNLPLDPLVDGIHEAWRSVRGFNTRNGFRTLPARIFEHETPMSDGRGTITRRILDAHPLGVSPIPETSRRERSRRASR